MPMSIGCRELGIDCDFIALGETGAVAIDSIMRHLQAAHAEDWFEVEEIYQIACSVVRAKAA